MEKTLIKFKTFEEVIFHMGVNDYFWFRDKPPVWMKDSLEIAMWWLGHDLAKAKDIKSPSVNG